MSDSIELASSRGHGARKVALVAGGSSGIGSAVARRLAEDGAQVVVHFGKSEAAASKVAADIAGMARESGGTIVPAKLMHADVTKSAEVGRLFADVEATFGGLDIMVSCVGGHAPRPTSIADTADDVFDSVLDANLRASFYLLRESMRRLRSDGRVVLVSSFAARTAVPNQAVYNVCKTALDALVGLAARELRGRAVTVNAVVPGPTATETLMKRIPEERVQQLSQQIPLGRMGHPKDIANVVSFLVGLQGGWVNGQTIVANGGLG